MGYTKVFTWNIECDGYFDMLQIVYTIHKKNYFTTFRLHMTITKCGISSLLFKKCSGMAQYYSTINDLHYIHGTPEKYVKVKLKTRQYSCSFIFFAENYSFFSFLQVFLYLSQTRDRFFPQLFYITLTWKMQLHYCVFIGIM